MREQVGDFFLSVYIEPSTMLVCFHVPSCLCILLFPIDHWSDLEMGMGNLQVKELVNLNSNLAASIGDVLVLWLICTSLPSHFCSYFRWVAIMPRSLMLNAMTIYLKYHVYYYFLINDVFGAFCPLYNHTNALVCCFHKI